jgi:hypothetical protein
MLLYIRCFLALLSPCTLPPPSFCIRRDTSMTRRNLFFFCPRNSSSHHARYTHPRMPDPAVDLARSRTTTTLHPSESSASGFRRVIDVPPDNGKKKRGGLFKRRPDPSEYRDPYEQVCVVTIHSGGSRKAKDGTIGLMISSLPMPLHAGSASWRSRSRSLLSQ